MKEHIYSASNFWWVVSIVDQFIVFFYPYVLVVLVVVWFIKSKTMLALVALFGALLTVGASLTHRIVGKVNSVSMGYMVPHIEENVFIWFLFKYGINLGIFIFCLALLIHFITVKRT